MAEFTEEEALDHPANPPAEDPPDEMISHADAEAITPNQEPFSSAEAMEDKKENMEVHHHPRLDHKPKPWKEYFLEFIMIFLAVTLGFFAENLREHFTENERAQQYAQSLYDDLKVDTAIIQRTYAEKVWIEAKYDSAETILASNDLGKNNEFIYYVERYVTYNDVFSSQDITYQQLRSSGNFRYIKKINLYKSIADYYNLYSRYENIDGTFGAINKNELSDIEAKLFNPRDLTDLDNTHAGTFYDLVLRPGKKLTPIVNDKTSLTLLYLKISNTKQRITGSMSFLGWLKTIAAQLIDELKKEYELK